MHELMRCQNPIQPLWYGWLPRHDANAENVSKNPGHLFEHCYRGIAGVASYPADHLRGLLGRQCGSRMKDLTRQFLVKQDSPAAIHHLDAAAVVGNGHHRGPPGMRPEAERHGHGRSLRSDSLRGGDPSGAPRLRGATAAVHRGNGRPVAVTGPASQRG